MAGNISTSYFATDLQNMIGDLYTVVTGLGSSAVSASITDLTIAQELDVGGEILRVTQSMVFPASAISSPITIVAYVTLGTAERMIAGYQQSADGVSYTIDIADPTT